MTDKKKILFVNDEMQMGGVARVLNTLMASLPEDRYEIDLLVLHKEGMLLSEIPSKVHVIEGTPFFNTVDEALNDLIKRREFSHVMGKLRLLTYMKTGLIKKKIVKERKKILSKKYDIEVAAKEGFCTIFTAYGDSAKKINWILTDYSVCNYSKNHMPLVKEALKHIDLNIADSRHAMEAYKEVFGVDNGMAIHNLMDTERVKNGMKADDGAEINGTDGPNVISVARFHPQKSIDRLLIASKETYDAGNHHTLYLVGGGQEEEKLRQMVKDMDMHHVVFLGYRQNPYGMIRKCDLFVLSSLYEGFAT
ncbi:MAG: glycosyltransferase, partial [Solobacterium sp.]|nr:glycosyltransferase [Solobacterium sp.]